MLSNIRSWKGGAVAAIVGIALLAVPTVPALAGAGPTVSSFNPSSGSPGAIVSVTGNGFMGGSGVSSVAFGAVPTTFNVSDDQHLSATVPFGATTKSPLNSGLRHTTTRTESPGASIEAALPEALPVEGVWADPGVVSATTARSASADG